MKRACLILPVFLSLFLAPCVARAAEARQLSASYDVYAGGIHALQARLNYTVKGDRYDITLESETYGLLGKLVPWRARFKTKGWVLKDKFQPQEHVSDTTSKGKHEVNTYKYSKNGGFLSFTQLVDGRDETRKDLDPAIMRGTTDVLSANFNVMRKLSLGESCKHEEMLFDSERSYRLMFKQKRKDVLVANKYSGFKGAAQSCTVEIKPEGGKWHKKPRGWLKIQEQARANGELPAIWYADLGAVKRDVSLPVKIMIKTNYGTFIAHLTSFEEKSAK